jgi:hypothetical protein
VPTSLAKSHAATSSKYWITPTRLLTHKGRILCRFPSPPHTVPLWGHGKGQRKQTSYHHHASIRPVPSLPHSCRFSVTLNPERRFPPYPVSSTLPEPPSSPLATKSAPPVASWPSRPSLNCYMFSCSTRLPRKGVSLRFTHAPPTPGHNPRPSHTTSPIPSTHEMYRRRHCHTRSLYRDHTCCRRSTGLCMRAGLTTSASVLVLNISTACW